jgi:hypothetical protein
MTMPDFLGADSPPLQWKFDTEVWTAAENLKSPSARCPDLSDLNSSGLELQITLLPQHILFLIFI